MELYIHIPFCVRKCEYCDFLSFPAEEGIRRRYVDSLLREIGSYHSNSNKERVSSIFFGGGTPSLLPAEWMGEILHAVRDNFNVEQDAEISMEANPGTVSEEQLRRLREAGINRLSFGLQSSVDGELARLGRIHTFVRFLESYMLARKAGFANVNVDLMFGIPGQTVQSWEATLRKVSALAPEHISAYSLIIEEGTPFFQKYSRIEEKIEEGLTAGELASEERREGLPAADYLPDEETERSMYEMVPAVLGEYGYRQYEISNFAKPGYECRHNIGYWTGVPYIGIGLGASSYLGHVRYKNTENLADYLSGKWNRAEEEVLTLEDEMAEFMILGLRMTKGVAAADFQKRFGREIGTIYGDVIRQYEENGLLAEKDGRIFLTREGLSLSNVVMADFLP